MRVRAKTYMYYNKQGYNIGAEYDMDDRESATADLLEKLGKIEIVSKAIPSIAKQTLRTTAMKVEDDDPNKSTAVDPMMTDPQQQDRGRIFRRRDMRSQK